ncbi:MAG: sodium:proton antiporter [Gammaproteobacteria bacterium RIFCSPHIGHO2_12_FULL_41_20]|nr:MAG: sodium:proton antiporter [Gammaproteobacteria bacterium RIFCSPHIGHO2_12_FULL_41_20]
MDNTQSIAYVMFLIFTGTALLSTVALFTRQSLLVAYIALGAILGPWGLKLVSDSAIIDQTGEVGIIFLLFLLGLHLQPQNLFHSLRKMSWIAFISSVLFFLLGFIVSYVFNFRVSDCFIIGAATMFSSTIIGLKLLPTTVLHHQHTGELVISVLLLQDLLAILVLLILQAIADQQVSIRELLLVIIAVPTLLLVAYVFAYFFLSWLLKRFDKFHEYIFILSIGWCLCMAQLSHVLGLSAEIGAFIAGVALASNPISLYIAENLKPVRDFFLVIFFFAVGAGFNFHYLPTVIVPALILSGLTLTLKPVVFRWLLHRVGEVKSVSWEIGIRLGQMSEFSLLIVYLAYQTHLIQPTTTYMVQAVTILSFIVSCYWVVLYYPTPLATSDKLRRD